MLIIAGSNVYSANLLGNEDFTQEIYRVDDDLEEEGTGNFDTLNNWLFLENGGQATAELDDERLKIDISDGGGSSYAVQLLQAPLTIEEGYRYQVSFDARASKERDMEIKIGGTGGRGWTSYNPGQGDTNGMLFDLTEEMTTYEFDFVMNEETDDLARFEFQLGLDDGTIWIDNVEIEQVEQVEEADRTEPEPDTEWVYDDEFFFIFNVAVGGHWPGYPDETTEFPTSMEVDYIKVFDQDGNLEWEDQFDGDEINEDYWTFEVGNGHAQGIPGWGNAELQYYTDGENAWIEDDRLIIEAREEERTDEFGSYDYTSTRMITQSKVSMEYGRVEISAKLPDGGQGVWPALWMLGEDIVEVDWPQSGEIDIMEFLGQNRDEVHGTVHGPGHYAGDGIGNNYILPEGDFTEGFNTFILEWEEDEMRWYVNDELFHAIERTENNGVRKVELDESDEPEEAEEIAYTENQVVNGDFSSEIVDDMDGSPDNWYVWAGEGGAVDNYGVENGEFKIDITSLGHETWAVQFAQFIKMTPGDYQVSFEARADKPRDIIAMVQEDGGAWTVYGEETVELDSEMQKFTFDVSLEAEDIPKFVFSLGETDNGETTTVYFDNIEINKAN